MIQTLLRGMKRGHAALGLEITDQHIKMCEVQELPDGSHRVIHFAMRPLPPGTMNDGRIINEGMLHSVIQTLLDDREWSSRSIHFAIPSQNVMIRTVKLPDVKEKELRKLIQFELMHNLHLPFDEPFYDFIKLPKPTAAEEEVRKAEPLLETADVEWSNAETEAQLCEVMLVAAPMELLQTYVRLLESLGLSIRSMEIKAFSLQRLQEKCLPIERGTWLMLDINQTACDVSIVSDGVIKITRNIEVNLIHPGSAADPLSGEPLNGLFAEFRSPEQSFETACQDLVSELERLINFYRYTLNNRDQEFDSVIVSGDLPNMDKLISILKSRMAQKIVPLEWHQLPVEGDSSEWNVSAFAAPCGLALRGKQR
ncbi:type IV pilus biogenesis protein PilM [Paenibacillus abyssi]|uniref:Pilus assembly protein PilM n=1 Tax=Paenibacillus abyssi TaxID=1340531 RepID=A0A917LHD7_9BACL|nr:pilus assembly protein PilM [Paenibacillus abyssi]GGG23473.1 hypothetical protein GCM10010916_45060 [Paenibacillus abyssi]